MSNKSERVLPRRAAKARPIVIDDSSDEDVEPSQRGTKRASPDSPSVDYCPSSSDDDDVLADAVPLENEADDAPVDDEAEQADVKRRRVAVKKPAGKQAAGKTPARAAASKRGGDTTGEISSNYSVKELETLVRVLPVLLTGVREGETVQGTKTQSLGASMRWWGPSFPPSAPALHALRGQPHLWQQYLAKLGGIAFFTDMTMRAREEHVLSVATPSQDLYMDEVGARFEILELGDSDLRTLDEHALLQMATATEPLPSMTVRNFFPRKPGSAGLKGRQTLIFRPTIWRVFSAYRQQLYSPGDPAIDFPVFDVDQGVLIMPSKKPPLDKKQSSIRQSTNSQSTNSQSTMSQSSMSQPSMSQSSVEKKQRSSSEMKKLYVFESFGRTTTPVGFAVSTVDDRQRFGLADAEEEVLRRFSKQTAGDLQLLDAFFRRVHFTPGAYKSLLQKLVRYRAGVVLVPALCGDAGERTALDAEFVLCVTLAKLCYHVGSFVPDIQRFVPGSESALKRVVVTAFEDAWFDEAQARDVCSLLMLATLCQRVKGFAVAARFFQRLLDTAVAAFRAERAFVWDVTAGGKLKPYALGRLSDVQLASLLLDELKSFAGDLAMVRHIAASFPATATTRQSSRPDSVVIEHFVDQHIIPEIVYYYPSPFVERFAVRSSAPYGPFFVKLFSEVTGVNPRRPGRVGRTMSPHGWRADFERLEMVRETRRAQLLALVARLTDEPTTKRWLDDERYSLQFDLEAGVICGLVGALEIRVGRLPPALVTLNPNNPVQLFVVKKPSRDMKGSPMFSEEDAAKITAQARAQLQRGVPLNKCSVPVAELRGAAVQLLTAAADNDDDDDDEPPGDRLVVQLADGGAYDWEEFRRGRQLSLRVFELDVPLDDGPEAAVSEQLLLHSGGDGEGVARGADQLFEALLGAARPAALYRFAGYLAANTRDIDVSKVSRDGGANGQVPMVEDVAAYRLLLWTAVLYPSALRRVSALRFRVGAAPPLFRALQRRVQAHVRSVSAASTSSSSSSSSSVTWPPVHDTANRQLWQHQSDALQELIRNHENGRRGSFIWIPVGLGKTLITALYLEWLRARGELPAYVLYTLPASAIDSILLELRTVGLPCHVVVPLKSARHGAAAALRRCHVNLIEHDHLRRCEDLVVAHAASSLLVVDEVHKTLNDTKRTSVALAVSAMCREFVCLTGTPIIDTKIYKLMWWLGQISVFEVTEQNFFVAASSMINKKVHTGVKVELRELLAELPAAARRQYAQLVGPGLGGVNARPTFDDVRRAVELCYACATDALIEHVVELVTARGRRVFVVARNAAHADAMAGRLRGAGIADVFVIQRGASLYLTDETVRRGGPDYRVVVTTVNHATGYTLTRLNTMITLPYFSNNATREQLEGRINRIGQAAPSIEYITVHAGVLSHILHNHMSARNLSAVLQTLADDIVVLPPALK